MHGSGDWPTIPAARTRALLNVLTGANVESIGILPSWLSGNMCLSHGTSPIVFRSQALMASARLNEAETINTFSSGLLKSFHSTYMAESVDFPQPRKHK